MMCVEVHALFFCMLRCVFFLRNTLLPFYTMQHDAIKWCLPHFSVHWCELTKYIAMYFTLSMYGEAQRGVAAVNTFRVQLQKQNCIAIKVQKVQLARFEDSPTRYTHNMYSKVLAVGLRCANMVCLEGQNVSWLVSLYPSGKASRKNGVSLHFPCSSETSA